MHNQTFEFATTFFQIKKTHTHTPKLCSAKNCCFHPGSSSNPIIWIRVFAAKVSRISLWKPPIGTLLVIRSSCDIQSAKKLFMKMNRRLYSGFTACVSAKFTWDSEGGHQGGGPTSFPLLFPIRTLGFPVNPLVSENNPLSLLEAFYQTTSATTWLGNLKFSRCWVPTGSDRNKFTLPKIRRIYLPQDEQETALKIGRFTKERTIVYQPPCFRGYVRFRGFVWYQLNNISWIQVSFSQKISIPPKTGRYIFRLLRSLAATLYIYIYIYVCAFSKRKTWDKEIVFQITIRSDRPTSGRGLTPGATLENPPLCRDDASGGVFFQHKSQPPKLVPTGPLLWKTLLETNMSFWETGSDFGKACIFLGWTVRFREGCFKCICHTQALQLQHVQHVQWNIGALVGSDVPN